MSNVSARVDDEQVIPERWKVPPRFRERVGSHAGRQRAMTDNGHLLLILHAVPGAKRADRSAQLFWRTPEGAWRASGAHGDGLAALTRLLEQYHGAIVALDEQVDAGTTAEQLHDVLRRANPITRAARNLHKALQQARELVDDRQLITLRDKASDLERAVDLMQQDAKNALDFTAAKKAEEQAHAARAHAASAHRLNLLAALFLPISAFGSVFGINIRSGLEGYGPPVFWGVVATCFAAGLLVRAAVQK